MEMAATNEGNECKESPIMMMAMRVSIVLTVRSTMPQLAVSLSLFVRGSLYYLFCNICAEGTYGEIEIELIVYFSLFRFVSSSRRVRLSYSASNNRVAIPGIPLGCDSLRRR